MACRAPNVITNVPIQAPGAEPPASGDGAGASGSGTGGDRSWPASLTLGPQSIGRASLTTVPRPTWEGPSIWPGSSEVPGGATEKSPAGYTSLRCCAGILRPAVARPAGL